MYSRSILAAVVNFFVGLAEAILGIRVLFELFTANTANGFVGWIYDTSNTLLSPFRGIFPAGKITSSHVLDFSALFAMLIYAFFGYLLVELLDFIAARPIRHHTK